MGPSPVPICLGLGVCRWSLKLHKGLKVFVALQLQTTMEGKLGGLVVESLTPEREVGARGQGFDTYLRCAVSLSEDTYIPPKKY